MAVCDSNAPEKKQAEAAAVEFSRLFWICIYFIADVLFPCVLNTLKKMNCLVIALGLGYEMEQL